MYKILFEGGCRPASWSQALKGGPEAVALPASEASEAVKPVQVEEVDAELEDLKRSIDKL